MKSEYTKKSIATATARFIRKAGKRITKREAAKLGRLYGEDIHWKFLGSMGDKLSAREPGEFAKRWANAKYTDSIANAFKREARSPRRFNEVRGSETERWVSFLFWYYGPSSGRWPGDKLVFDGTGWVLATAA